MSLAVQVTDPYFDGMTLTGAMLQSEFSTLIAKVNNLDNDNINASAGILMTKTEMGASGRSTSNVGLRNDKKLYFQSSANVDDHYIYEDASGNNLLLTMGTAGKSFIFRDATPTNRFTINTTDSWAGTSGGYALRSYDSGNTKYVYVSHNGTDGSIGTSSGVLTIAPTSSSVYFVASLFGNASNTYQLGSAGTTWKDVFGQNAYTTVSDSNEKEFIEASPLGLEFIKALSPKRWKWKNLTDQQSHHRYHHGFIAQEIESVLESQHISTEEFAGFIKDEETGKYALRYTEFFAPMINAFQELEARVSAMEAK